MKKAMLLGLALGLLELCWGQGANAQEPGLNVVVTPFVFNDIANSNFTSIQALPIVFLFDDGVSAPDGFANRHVWSISVDGVTPLAFGIDDSFDISFDLVLSGTLAAPRKEAGILLTTGSAGEGQFIVNTDAGEVVAFGGPLPFFAFHTSEDEAARVTFASGDQISLRLRYVPPVRNESDMVVVPGMVEYYANGVSSGALEMANTEQGIPGPFVVSGYLQVVNDPANPNNVGSALFDSISWNGMLLNAPVPSTEGAGAKAP